MKRILFLMLIGTSFFAQATYSQEDCPYKSLDKFAGDTLDFVGYNFLQRAKQYESSKVEDVLKDYSIPITDYTPYWNYNDVSSKSLSEYTGIILISKREGISPSQEPKELKFDEFSIKILFEHPLSKTSPAGKLIRYSKSYTTEIFDAIKNLKVKSVEGRFPQRHTPKFDKYKKYMPKPDWDIDWEVYERVNVLLDSLKEKGLKMEPSIDSTRNDPILDLINEMYKEQEARKEKQNTKTDSLRLQMLRRDK